MFLLSTRTVAKQRNVSAYRLSLSAVEKLHTKSAIHQFTQISPAGSRDEGFTDESEPVSSPFALQNEEPRRFECSSLLEVMDERMKREENILSTSPHKKVVNAIRYAKAVNSTLESSLEKTLHMLHREFEQEFLRIVDVQRSVYEEYPSFRRCARSLLSGVTNRQFRRLLSETLANKERTEEFNRTRIRLSLPSLSSVGSASPQAENFYLPRPRRAKKDGDIVYLPPI